MKANLFGSVLNSMTRCLPAKRFHGNESQPLGSHHLSRQFLQAINLASINEYFLELQHVDLLFPYFLDDKDYLAQMN